MNMRLVSALVIALIICGFAKAQILHGINSCDTVPYLIFKDCFQHPDNNITNSIRKSSVVNGLWLENVVTPQFQTSKNQNNIGFRDCFNPIRKQTFQIKFSSPVKKSYYVKSLGVICRQELKLDNVTPMPVRFRLGSLEYVNWLEQKPNARRTY